MFFIYRLQYSFRNPSISFRNFYFNAACVIVIFFLWLWNDAAARCAIIAVSSHARADLSPMLPVLITIAVTASRLYFSHFAGVPVPTTTIACQRRAQATNEPRTTRTSDHQDLPPRRRKHRSTNRCITCNRGSRQFPRR